MFYFLVTVILVLTHCRCDKLVNSILDEVYGSSQDVSSKEESFVSKVWPRISEVIPVHIRIESFKKRIGKKDWPLHTLHLKDFFHDDYHPSFLFTKATDINFKLGDVLTTKCEKSDYFTNCIIEAKSYFTNPVNVELFVENSVKQKSEHISLSYLFEGPNTVQTRLKIPNFPEERLMMSSECIVRIDSLSIDKLSEPSGVSETTDLKQFWDSVKPVDIYNMFNTGIMKALRLKPELKTSRLSGELKETEYSWICLSDHFEPVDSHRGATKSQKRETKTEINQSQFIESIQLGIERSVTSLSSWPERYVLVTDFTAVEKVPHTLNVRGHKHKFNFITYAPFIFRHLRTFYGLKDEKYVETICRTPLIELTNPGKSGAGLYISGNKYLMAKTLQSKEAKLLIKLLPSYILHLHSNPVTLFPKLYGLYRYKPSIWRSFRIMVMNNILPPNIHMKEKYDLKGSTVNRGLDKKQLENPSPTYKDLVFRDNHPQGIYLKVDDYNTLVNAIESDSTMLKSFNIMDYSLLLGIHYIDLSEDESFDSKRNGPPCQSHLTNCQNCFNEERNNDNNNSIESGIFGWTAQGEKVKLFLGFIDILQTYNLVKKGEHFLKSFIHDRKGMSVQRPSFYARRFQQFISKSVFKPLPQCPAA